MTSMTGEVKAGWEDAEERSPTCNNCRRPIRIFVSNGTTGPVEVKFIARKVFHCQYCAETDRLKGMVQLLKSLIDEREE